MAETREDVIKDIKQGIANIEATGKRVRAETTKTDRLYYALLILVGFMIGLVTGLAF